MVLTDGLFSSFEYLASSDLQDHPETAVWCCEQVGVAMGVAHVWTPHCGRYWFDLSQLNCIAAVVKQPIIVAV